MLIYLGHKQFPNIYLTDEHVLIFCFESHLQHAETSRLHVSSAVHITLHQIHSIFGQSREQNALQVTRFLHLIGQLVYVARQLSGREKR